jgi:hypothetical protein
VTAGDIAAFYHTNQVLRVGLGARAGVGAAARRRAPDAQAQGDCFGVLAFHRSHDSIKG